MGSPKERALALVEDWERRDEQEAEEPAWVLNAQKAADAIAAREMPMDEALDAVMQAVIGRTQLTAGKLIEVCEAIKAHDGDPDPTFSEMMRMGELLSGFIRALCDDLDEARSTFKLAELAKKGKEHDYRN